MLLPKFVESGSSPLAQGTPRSDPRQCPGPRLIPVYTGIMAVHAESRQYPGAHPRSRGEHRASVSVAGRSSGLSPLARGTFNLRTGFRSGFGSSPLTQGTRSPPRPRKRRRRLIPARAGNMTGEQWSSVTMSAHPRSRGEHTGEDRCYPCWQGSSPLARGTCRGCSGPPALKRLIPARAGNMAPTGRHSRQATAHPRSRGEHSVSSLGGGVLVGSSPLARGTFGTGRALNVRVRLIPARAGNITLC